MGAIQWEVYRDRYLMHVFLLGLRDGGECEIEIDLEGLEYIESDPSLNLHKRDPLTVNTCLCSTVTLGQGAVRERHK